MSVVLILFFGATFGSSVIWQAKPMNVDKARTGCRHFVVKLGDR